MEEDRYLKKVEEMKTRLSWLVDILLDRWVSVGWEGWGGEGEGGIRMLMRVPVVVHAAQYIPHTHSSLLCAPPPLAAGSRA